MLPDVGVVVMLVALLVPIVTAPPGAWTSPIGPVGTPPRVVAGFDPPAAPWLRGHRGVDLATSLGATVRAPGDGVVAFAGPVAGRGVISLRHAGGLVTTYEPVRATVAAGTHVRRGQPIGRIDRFAVSHATCPTVGTVTCLHWGARREGVYVDPLWLLAAPRVRLLPPPAVLAPTPAHARGWAWR
jgi:murein DD-endopeptidase MepM/ murein hydrolase activator NlpD